MLYIMSYKNEFLNLKANASESYLFSFKINESANATCLLLHKKQVIHR